MLYTLLILNLVCTTIPIIVSNKKRGLIWSMIILFLFLALRYNFGNDYPAYYTSFYDGNDILEDSQVEVGYKWLTILFKPFGFFIFIIWWSAFYIIALYKTIRRYVPEEYYWLVIMSIISNADLVFFGASAIRQTLALCLFLFSLPFLEKKKIIPYSILIIIASLIHQSAILFIFLFPLMYLNLKNRVFIYSFGIIAFLIMTVFKTPFENIIQIISESNFEKYSDRYLDTEREVGGGGIGTIVRILFLIAFLWSMSFETSKIKEIFFILAICSIVIFTMRNQVGLQRLTLYFGYMMAFSFSYVLGFMKTKLKILYMPFLVLVLLWNINMAIVFASQEESLFEYHTIFESNTIEIPQ